MENWRKFMLQERMTQAMRDRILQIPAADAGVPASGLDPDKIRTQDLIRPGTYADEPKNAFSGFQSLPIDHIRLEDVYKRAQDILLKKAKNPFLKKIDKVAPGWPGIEYKLGQTAMETTNAWVPARINPDYHGVQRPPKYKVYIHDLPFLRFMKEIDRYIYEILGYRENFNVATYDEIEYTTRQELKTVTDIVHDFAALAMAPILIHELRHIYDQERYRMRYLKPIFDRDPHRNRGEKPIPHRDEEPEHPHTSRFGSKYYTTLNSQVLEKYARNEEVKFAPIMEQEILKIIQRINLFKGDRSGGTPMSRDRTLSNKRFLRKIRKEISDNIETYHEFHRSTSKWFEKVKKRNARDRLTAKLMAKYLPKPEKSNLHHGD